MLKKILFILLLALPLTNQFAQTLTIGRPTLSFTQACANPSFNSFGVQINFSATPSIDANNQFTIELSSATGDFSTPTIMYTSAKGEITTTGTKIMVVFPTTTSGEGYRIRVKGSVPAATGTPTNPFAAYYKPQDSQFTINNTIPAASYCTGGSYILSIDPNGNGVTNSPLEFPFLTYNWYRDNNTPTITLPPTLVAGASGSSYTVTSPGVYYVETNYGTCTSDSYSNRVTVTASNTNGSATITSSLGNPFCASQGATVLSTPAGQSYQWFKDDVAIAGATNQTYSASVGAKYSVKVDYGGCQANAAIALQEFQLTASLNVPLEPETTAITPGQSLDVIVTTDAVNPKFQWFLNNTAINGATSSTYSVAVKGNYKVIVTEQGSCNINKELPFIIRYDSDPDPFPNVSNIPNLISPNGDFINDTWIIPLEYANQENVQIEIVSSYGEVALKTYNYQNNWPDSNSNINFTNINPVYYYIITTADNSLIKGSITVIK